MNYLFICGTARSGTTAMWRLLTSDDRLVIGLERYVGLCSKQAITEELFTFERFNSLQEGDSFHKELPPYYKRAARLFAKAEYIGDKSPRLFNHLDDLFANIPNAKVIFMLRNIIDVAASYEARANDESDKSWSTNRRTGSAIKDWHQSLIVLNKYIDDERVFPVIHESFFSSINNIESLYRFLNLIPNEAVLSRCDAVVEKNAQLEKHRNRNFTLDAVQQICETAPFDLYREVLLKIRAKQSK